MRKRSAAALVVVLAGLFAALAAVFVPRALAAQKSTQVTICYANKATDFLPLWVAANHGFFNANGLDVKLVLTQRGTGTQVLTSGACQIDMDGIVGMLGIAQGAPFVAFGGDSNRFGFELVARTASNINKVTDLKGKTLALSSANGAVGIAGLALLRSFGLSTKDVHVVYIPSITARLAALASGSIDALIASPPVSPITKNGQAKVVYDMQKKFRFILVADWTTRTYAEQHPDVLRAFLRSWIQAVKWMKAPANKSQVITDIGNLTGITDQASGIEAYNYSVPNFENVPLINRIALDNSIAIVQQQTGKLLTPADVLYNGPLSQVLTYRLSKTLSAGKAKGTFSATVNQAGVLKWKLSFSGLNGAASGAYVSPTKPAAHGYLGDRLCAQCKGSQSGTTNVGSRLLNAIWQGDAYVNITTAARPRGALTGKIVATPGS